MDYGYRRIVFPMLIPTHNPCPVYGVGIATTLSSDNQCLTYLSYKSESNESRPSRRTHAHRQTISLGQESLLPCSVEYCQSYLSGSLHLVRCSGRRGVALTAPTDTSLSTLVVLPTTAHRSKWSDQILACHIRCRPRRPAMLRLAWAGTA